MDIEALRKKLEESKERSSRGGGTRNDFWKPLDGRNVIRILPAKDGGNDFYAEALVHYNVGPKNRMVTCGKTDGHSCPVCDFVDALFKSGDESDAKLAKKMKAKPRYYFNVVDRSVQEGTEDFGKILVYGAGVGVFQDILGIIIDPDYGNITDSEEGYDIIITKSGKMLDTEYKVNARPKQNPIGVADWNEKMADLERYRKSRSGEDLIKILNGEDVSEEDNDDKSSRSSVSDRNSSKPSSNKEDASNDGDADDIENEIQAVLNRRKK